MLITEAEIASHKEIPRHINGIDDAILYAENQMKVLFGSAFVLALETESYKDILFGNKDIMSIKKFISELVYIGLLRNENVFLDNVGFVQKETKDSVLINSKTRYRLINKSNKMAFGLFKDLYVYLKRNNAKYPDFDPENLVNIFSTTKIELI
ncbi:MAG: hypothetical protein N4A45_10295 [Flavobacteriales bacterium]|jgi:hypothetical protein|nr:hypothetical protein [Flavobacteriales bacterium]